MWASSARTITAAALPSATPEQSMMLSGAAAIGDPSTSSMLTSLRNWARGLAAPFLWFFQAMRASVRLPSAGSTP